MSLFSDNIRSLRIKRKLSQEKLAAALEITRGRYVKYEDGTSEAPYEILKRIAHFFHISIDLLLAVDVRKISTDDLMQLEGNRLVLPITVDASGNNLIEIVTQKAKAGYLTGYSDPEYIEQLPQLALPLLGPGKYRAFPITGDSMPPHNEQSWIVGKYVENLGEVRNGKTYILITATDGMTYKRLNGKNADSLTVASDNLLYHPYAVKLSDILEIWEYAAHIGRDDAAMLSETESIKGLVVGLSRDVGQIKRRLDLE